MAKLWEKGYQLNELIERFTVGRDYLLDRELVYADCLAGAAHARMLASAGLIEAQEAAALTSGLAGIAAAARNGEFTVRREDEDCHTALEVALTEGLGEVGKKIHTGRSRNDQVLAALRLYAKEGLHLLQAALQHLTAVLLRRAEEEKATPMPGRTHLQIAMPSTVGLYLAALAEESLDNLELLEAVYRQIDRNPLGSAASYGTPLPLDREMTATLLGFEEVHNNVLATQHARGRSEGIILGVCEQIGLTLSRYASDLIILSLPEVGYFALPQQLCSGSSIMPQKRNPDGLELIRGKAASLSGRAQSVRGVMHALPAGYNRDLQETKEPLMRGLREAIDMVLVMAVTMEQLEVNRDRLEGALSAELFATDAAYDRVRGGMSFRDAYRAVAASVEAVEVPAFENALAQRTSTGAPGNLNLRRPLERLGAARARLSERFRRLRQAAETLLPESLPLYPLTAEDDALLSRESSQSG
ncbi:MAG: argininosuccinate lyase [Spirochaetaceae bacterium]